MPQLRRRSGGHHLRQVRLLRLRGLPHRGWQDHRAHQGATLIGNGPEAMSQVSMVGRISRWIAGSGSAARRGRACRSVSASPPSSWISSPWAAPSKGAAEQAAERTHAYPVENFQYPQSALPSELKIADYILACPEQVTHFSSQELAQQADVSQSSIVKFTQKIGFKGFTAFKLAVSEDLGRKHAIKTDNVGDLYNGIYATTIWRPWPRSWPRRRSTPSWRPPRRSTMPLWRGCWTSSTRLAGSSWWGSAARR